MKILITGGSGLLGQYLNIQLSKSNEILALYKNNIGNCDKYKSAKVNIVDYPAMEEIFKEFYPNVVIHTAGFTRPEACTEDNKADVYKTNVEATKAISQLCERYNVKLIFTSTDLVYDGNSEGMLKESSKLNPISIYAETKLKAEKEIAETFDNYIILRTSLLIGFGLNHSRNNFQLMYNKMKAGERPKLFSDQFRTPFSLLDASEIISKFVKTDIKEIILNFGGHERVSRVELGELLCKITGLDKNLIEKIKMSDVPGFPIVKDVSLNTGKLQSFGFKQKPLEEAIIEIVKSKT